MKKVKITNKQKKFEPKKGGDNLHVKLTGPASMGTGGGVKGDRGVFYGNIETAVSDNTKVKSTTKFLGAIGMTKGLLGGARDLIANKRAANQSGQEYSFKQGLGDFAQGAIGGIIGGEASVNRAGAPPRSMNNMVYGYQPDMNGGNMSQNQMDQYNQMNGIAQNNPQAPVTMKKIKK